ncbi:hypothetical protein Pfo_029395 [Paulownia fortunei]|nr:hypothetical protein Pfo_029395 [Paulownia fortunei]
MSGQNPSSNHCSRTYWTPTMEQYFVNLMLEHIHRGNRIGHTFNKQAWTDMLAVFNAKFGSQYDKDVLKGRYTNLWKLFNDIKNILGQNGFSWDETRQMVVADDYVWDAYIKEHPEILSYKDKVIEHYSELCTIFGTTELVDRKLSCNLEVEFDQHPIDIKVDEYSGDLPVTFLETEIYDQVKKRPSSTSLALECHSKAQKTGKKVREDFTNITSVVTKLVNKEAGNNYFAIESAIDALQAIPNIDDELLLDSCDLLEDERKAKTFLALDATLRKKWLLRKLGRS